MKKCWNCDEVLTSENTDREHIIPNSCGGKLKPRWLLCEKCNNKAFGTAFDNKLAEQVGGIANLLMIKKNEESRQISKASLLMGKNTTLKMMGLQ